MDSTLQDAEEICGDGNVIAEREMRGANGMVTMFHPVEIYYESY